LGNLLTFVTQQQHLAAATITTFLAVEITFFEGLTLSLS
jgi:hypothetical protein